MDKVELTTDEKEELKEKIQQAKTYKNKKLKELILIIIVPTTFVFGKYYWLNNISWPMFLVTLTFIIIIISVFLIGWYFVGHQIDIMENDLKSGIKMTGISKIKKINIVNRKIKLVDGTTVYENNDQNEKLVKGDKIFYRATISGEHIFEYRKE